MKWQTKNHLGEVVTWYSEDVIEKIRELTKKIRCGECESLDCAECYKKFRTRILQIIEK